MSTLGRHIKSVHDDQRQLCQHCRKSYRNLEIHIKTVHMELNTFCDICDEEIPWSMKYNHIYKFHPNVEKSKKKDTSKLNSQNMNQLLPSNLKSDVDTDADIYSDLNLDDEIQLNGRSDVKQIIVNGKNFHFSLNN